MLSILSFFTVFLGTHIDYVYSGKNPFYIENSNELEIYGCYFVLISKKR